MLQFVNKLITRFRKNDELVILHPTTQGHDLGRALNNGWNTKITSFLTDIGRDPNAYNIMDDGEMVYDVRLRNDIKAEFADRGLTVNDQTLNHRVLWRAAGHSDYVAQLSRACRALEQDLRDQLAVKLPE